MSSSVSKKGRRTKSATSSGVAISSSISSLPQSAPQSDIDVDSIAPDDSASQVIRARWKGKAPDRQKYDTDDLTDEDLCDEENDLRGLSHYLCICCIPDFRHLGRARRDYHADFYKAFKKPTLERDKRGAIVYTEVKGKSHVPTYIFECIRCVCFHGYCHRLKLYGHISDVESFSNEMQARTLLLTFSITHESALLKPTSFLNKA